MTDCCFTDVRNISIVRQISGHHKPSSQRNPWRVGVLDFQRTDLVPPQWGGFLWSKDHRFRVYGCPEDIPINRCLLMEPKIAISRFMDVHRTCLKPPLTSRSTSNRCILRRPNETLMAGLRLKNMSDQTRNYPNKKSLPDKAGISEPFKNGF